MKKYEPMRWMAHGRGVLSLTLLAASTVGAAGCAPQPFYEKRSSVTSKYLAADPVMTVKASPETLAAHGISEWRMYRGRGGVYLTGFDKKGGAVKGLASEFSRSADSSVRDVLVSINDGSKFAALHTIGTKGVTTTGPIPANTRQFVDSATRDLGLLTAALLQRRRLGLTTTAVDQCGLPMVRTVLNPLVGIGQAGGPLLPAVLQGAAFANDSGNACVRVARLGGLQQLPFGGRIGTSGSTICASNPNPALCRDQFATVDSVGRAGGLTFDPGSSTERRLASAADNALGRNDLLGLNADGTRQATSTSTSRTSTSSVSGCCLGAGGFDPKTDNAFRTGGEATFAANELEKERATAGTDAQRLFAANELEKERATAATGTERQFAGGTEAERSFAANELEKERATAGTDAERQFAANELEKQSTYDRYATSDQGEPRVTAYGSQGEENFAANEYAKEAAPSYSGSGDSDYDAQNAL